MALHSPPISRASPPTVALPGSRLRARDLGVPLVTSQFDAVFDMLEKWKTHPKFHPGGREDVGGEFPTRVLYKMAMIRGTLIRILFDVTAASGGP